MTDIEREIKRLISYIRSCREAGIDCTVTIDKSLTHGVLNALTEILQYREIGTVEECREARERQNPEKVIDICGALGEKYGCPECGSSLDDTDLFAGNCKWCGQKLCK